MSAEDDGAHAPAAGAHDAFISYARRPSDEAFVDELCRELETRGKRVWIDRSDIPPGADWLARISKGIEGASSLIFVLSPHSASSTVCQQELSIALEQNKRVIPILHQAVDPDQLPPALARLNWIPFTPEDDRDEALARLFDAVDTDLEWRDDHTRLTVRANEWLEAGPDSSFLLRGRDLREAETWYAQREGHKESPTPAQTDYIIASRRAASRRQRLLLAAVTCSLAVAIALAIFALVQRSEAVHQADLALSRQLAVEASGQFAVEASVAGGSDVRLESLLALEGYSRAPTEQAQSALVGAVEQPLVATMPAIVGHGEVEALADSPNGHFAAVGMARGAALWNLRTRTLAIPTFDNGMQINGVAFSPNGRWLAVAEALPPSRGGRGAAAVYRVGSRRPAYTLRGLMADATSVAFSPSGDQVAVVTDPQTNPAVPSEQGGVDVLWTFRSGAHPQLSQSPYSGALSVQFAPDGSSLAVAGGTAVTDGENGFVETLRVGRSLTLEHTDTVAGSAITHIAYISGGSTLAAATDAGQVEFFGADQAGDMPSGTPIDVGAAATALVGDPNAGMLATGDDSGAVRLWNVATRSQVGETMQDGSVVYALAFAPGGRTLLAGGYDGGLFIWNGAGETPLARGIQAGSDFNQLAISGNGRLLVTFTANPQTGAGTTTAWNLASGHAIGRRVPRPTSGLVTSTTSGDAQQQVTAVAANPSGTTVALGLVDGDVLLENRTLHVVEATLPQYRRGDVLHVAFSPNGRLIAVGYSDGVIALWHTRTGKPAGSLAFPRRTAPTGGVTALAWSPDGTRLAAADEDSVEAVFDPAHPTAAPAHINAKEAVFSLAYTPDGATIVAGDDAGNVELFRAAHPTSGPFTTLAGDGSTIYEVSVSPDGRVLATGDSNGTLRLWDLSSAQQLGVALTGASATYGAAFSRTGQLVTGGDGNRVMVWPALFVSRSARAFSDDLCPRLSQNLSPAQWDLDAAGNAYHATCPGLPAG